MSGGITVRQEAARSSSGFFLFTDSVRESFALIGGRRSRGNGLEQRGQRMRKETNWLTVAGCRAFSDSNQCRSRNPARRRIRHRQTIVPESDEKEIDRGPCGGG